MEKVKLDSLAITALTEQLKEYSKEELLQSRSTGEWTNPHFPLNKLTFDELANALYVGYELAPTKEERIKEVYDFYKQQADSPNHSINQRGEPAVSAILSILEIIKMEIKGVNVL